MDDFSINAKITADSSEFTKEINKAKNSTSNLGKEVKGSSKGITSNIGNVIKSAGKIAGVVGGITVALKGVNKVIKETTEAYRVQSKAETQLSTAIKNNPMLSSGATSRLKEFASEMQNISTTGDEVMLPMLANLISTGRSEEEAMQIMRASLDLSASGMMSLDSAVTQLNATFNGNVGLMGRQIGELKGLTEEELKSGKAVEIVAQKFKGLSEEVARNTGTTQQLKNAWSDLKEEIGYSFEKNLSPMRKFFSDMVSGWASALRKKRDYYEIEEKASKGDIEATEELLKRKKEELEKQKQIGKESQETAMSIEEASAFLGLTVEELKASAFYTGEFEGSTYGASNGVSELEKEVEELTEKLKKLKEEAKGKTTTADDEVAKIKKEANEALSAQLKLWKIQEQVTGEKISDEEKLKFYQENTIEAMQKANGKISTGNQFYKDRMKIIDNLSKKIKNVEMVESNKLAYEQDLENYKENEDLKIKALIARLEEEKKLQAEKDKENPLKSYIDGLKDFKREMSNFSANFSGIKEAFSESFGGGINQIIKFSEDYTSIFKKMFSDVKGYISNVSSMSLSQFNEMVASTDDIGGKIGMYLARGFGKGMEALGEFGQALYVVYKAIETTFSTIVKVAKTAFSALKKVISFNMNDSLDMILKFEDGVLTFFVETLPKLPSFFMSVIQSVKQMIETIKRTIKVADFIKVVQDIFKQIIDYLPQFATDVVDGLLNLVMTIIDTLYQWIEGNGVQKLFDNVFSILKKLFDFIIKNADKIATILVDTVIQIVDSLANNLPEIVEVLLRAALTLVTEVITKLIPKIPEILVKVLQTAGNILASVGKIIWESITAGFGAFGNWIGGLLGFATGANNVPSGLAIVGEQGPELIDMHGGERVYNAQNTKAILSGAGNGGNSFNVTFNNVQDTSAYEMMRELKAYNRQMAINGVL